MVIDFVVSIDISISTVSNEIGTSPSVDIEMAKNKFNNLFCFE